MAENEMPCRWCGTPIIFIRTEAGRLMPCDAMPQPYWPTDSSGILVYQRDGSCVRGTLRGHDSACAGYGYIPHWASCTNKPRKRPERRPSPARLALREQIAREWEAREEREAREAEKRAAAERLREAEERQTRLF